MISITKLDPVMESIFNFMDKANIPNFDKRSNEVFKNSVVDKYWFDKINNYFKSLDLHACCYKTYNNKVNWKSRYLDIKYSGFFGCFDKDERCDINCIIKRYSSSELVFVIDPGCVDIPELWLQDNGHQKIDLFDEFMMFYSNKNGNYDHNDNHLIFDFNGFIIIWSNYTIG